MKAGNFKRAIAEALANECYCGFNGSGKYYAVDNDNDGVCDGVYFSQNNAQFDPWPRDAEAVPVMAFADEFSDYSDEDDDTEPEDMISFIMDTMHEESQSF